MGEVKRQTNENNLPSVEPDFQKKILKANDILKGSFQLDESGKDKLSGGTWIHWALVIIPVMLLLSIVVILYAFFLHPSSTSKGSYTQSDQSEAVTGGDITRMSPAPIIQNEQQEDDLKVYFETKSTLWKDEFLNFIPVEAYTAKIAYEQADDEDKPHVAKDFITVLMNARAGGSSQDWNLFVSDLEQKLEQEVGEPISP